MTDPRNRVSQMRLLSTIAAAATIAMTTSRCGTSPDNHYYTLSAAPETSAADKAISAQTVFAIGTVSVPKILDQPEIARRIGPNQIVYSEYDRWATALDDLVRHALAGDLSSELGMTVLPAATALESKPQISLQLDIERYEADGNGAVFLEARWTVSDMDYPPNISLSGRAKISTPSEGASAAAIAQTMSNALGSLASQIAETARVATRMLPPTRPTAP